MKILLTNHALDIRAGSELYVRDVALALLARGHDPVSYSRRLGEVARELRQATVPVLDDLTDSVSEPPDVLHLQHHLEAMTALARFPNVPAIYVCHGWLPPEEAPPLHPRILRYVAVDDLVRHRLIDECGVPPERVVTLLNFVDLDRFPRRELLPERPSLALAFSNYLSEAAGLPELRRACNERGIELDALGLCAGRMVERPEELLGRYDVVFAKGRAAMEAAATGCAVVLCDTPGLGPSVSSADLERLRRLNFGVRLLRDPITVVSVGRRLDRYDAADAGVVTDQMRRLAGLDLAVERLLELYDEVRSEYAAAPRDPEEEARAVSKYLRCGPLTGGLFDFELRRYETELTRATDWAGSLETQLRDARADCAALRARGTDLENELQTAATQLSDARADCAALENELRAAKESLGRMESDRARIFEEVRSFRGASMALVSQLGGTMVVTTPQREETRAGRRTRVPASSLSLPEQYGPSESDSAVKPASRPVALAGPHAGPALADGADDLLQECRVHVAELERLLEAATGLREELEWMRSSATWQLRDRLVRHRWVRRIYRALRSVTG